MLFVAFNAVENPGKPNTSNLPPVATLNVCFAIPLAEVNTFPTFKTPPLLTVHVTVESATALPLFVVRYKNPETNIVPLIVKDPADAPGAVPVIPSTAALPSETK